MVTRGTNQQSSAPYNRRIVLDVIRRHGSLSRKEIVDTVSLSPQTVIGCKRLCIDTGYYEAFNRPNVTLIDIKDSPIEAIVQAVEEEVIEEQGAEGSPGPSAHDADQRESRTRQAV